MVKNLPANAGDIRDNGFDSWVRKIPWRRKQQPTPYSCLENPMDKGACRLWFIGSQRVRLAWSDIAHTGAEGQFRPQPVRLAWQHPSRRGIHSVGFLPEEQESHPPQLGTQARESALGRQAPYGLALKTGRAQVQKSQASLLEGTQRVFLHGPEVNTQSSRCRGHGFPPWSGN